MEARDKKILVNSVSIVLIVVVLANVYRGITVSKVGIPGLLDIEFNSGDNPPTQSSDRQVDESDQDNNKPAGINNQGGQNSSIQQVQNPRESVSTNDQQDFLTPDGTENEAQAADRSAAFNLSGLWYGDDGSEYEIYQSGNIISFTEYGMFGVTASGNGTITDSSVILEYETVFGTYGVATLQISNNGQIMTGSADDYSSGSTTFLNLTRN